MTKIDDIYAAVDDFGLITSAEAQALGASNAEVVQMARRGRLVRVGRGVYRMPVWPYQEAAPYATAVKAVGADAYLCGESVVALLHLAPTDPNTIWVGTPHRVRKSLGEGVRVSDRRPTVQAVAYEGVPCQPAAQAIREAAKTMGRERALQAADEARRQGYITDEEQAELARRLRK